MNTCFLFTWYNAKKCIDCKYAFVSGDGAVKSMANHLVRGRKVKGGGLHHTPHPRLSAR